MKTTITKTLLAAVVLLAAAAPAFAQDEMTDRLGERLELSDRQKTAVTEAAQQAEQGDRLWAVAGALQDVLSEEQKDKLLQQGQMAAAYGRGVREGRRSAQRAENGRRGARRTDDGRLSARRADDGRLGARRADDGRRGARAERGQERQRLPLNRIPDLTDDQKEALGDLREAHRETFEQLREDNASREAMQEHAEGMRAQVAEILTDEQRERLESRRRGGAPATMPGRGVRARTPGQGLSEALDLTDEQQELMAIHRALTAGMGAQRAQRGR